MDVLYEDTFSGYGVFVTTMLIFMFSRKASGRPPVSMLQVQRSPGVLFFSAIIGTLLWNGWFTWSVCRTVIFESLYVQDLDQQFELITKSMSWFVTPIIAFYFGSEKT